MIHRTPFILPMLYPSLEWRVPTATKEIYLTFDDGPVPGPTEFVLETLAAARARATFFCIGDNVRRHTSVYERLVTAGHAVGNHTFNHLNGWKTPTDRYLQNIQACAEAIAAPADTQPARRLFRPPYGRITRSQIQHLRDYRIIMWDVLSVDYDKSLPAERCLRNTLRAVRPGSIVVFHDSLKAEKNMTYALPRVLEQLAGEGYRFKSLHE
ncbi:polysaccharide deacetylase family protein [Dawidia soli]|uniref:Polysaccharide deacetylase family protein n=1 Tax=Dawidia soli TaxID=2782352 RepID=A0AAP2GIX4_9BACT|nr:polysaccharide deacetylase family protein [Dawidia soli]MBT1687890.1 polysaccharide deacetylase family protein [Dawidia soli]